MPVQALQCKECDTTYPLDARYVCERCFGPLEVAYDYSGIDPAEAKRKIQAGPQTIWRYADFLPFSGPPAAGLPVGLTPLQRAPRLAEALSRRPVTSQRNWHRPSESEGVAGASQGHVPPPLSMQRLCMAREDSGPPD